MLLPFFEWMEGLAVYGSSVYIGPVVNLVHLLSMVMFAGAVLIVDLRLLGGGLTHRPVAEVARDAQPWLVGGLAGLTLTGIPALMATATLQYANSVFWFKMYVLAAAVIFTFTLRRRATLADEARLGRWGKLVAILSIAMWASVAASARLIMLVPANTLEFLVG